jgi:hypothetical protein
VFALSAQDSHADHFEATLLSSPATREREKRFAPSALYRARRQKLFDKLGWWNEIVEDLE